MRKKILLGILSILFLITVILLVWLGVSRSSPSSPTTTEAYADGGIARCHYGKYTPLLTCGGRAFHGSGIQNPPLDPEPGETSFVL